MTHPDNTGIKQPEQALIAYHANCLDGFTAAWVTFNSLSSQGYLCTLKEMFYTNKSIGELLLALDAEYYKYLYVVDFSLKKDVLRKITISMMNLNIIVLDHHKTAFEEYCPEYILGGIEPDSYFNNMVEGAEILLDNSMSGAAICSKWFSHPKDVSSWLVAYVSDYDTWQYKYGDVTKYVNKYLQLQDKTLERWDTISQLFEQKDSFAEILSVGKNLQETHDKRVVEIAYRAVDITLTGETGLAVECPKEFVDDVGHALAVDCGTFGLMYRVNIGKNEITWGLRSEPGYDVSALAKKFGGGGHACAAGFVGKLLPEIAEPNGDKQRNISNG